MPDVKRYIPGLFIYEELFKSYQNFLKLVRLTKQKLQLYNNAIDTTVIFSEARYFFLKLCFEY